MFDKESVYKIILSRAELMLSVYDQLANFTEYFGYSRHTYVYFDNNHELTDPNVYLFSFCVSAGLCDFYNLGIRLSIGEELFESWEHYSGDAKFPVFVADSELSAADQYYETENNFYDGEYGAKRKELLIHIIKTLKEKLGETNA